MKMTVLFSAMLSLFAVQLASQSITIDNVCACRDGNEISGFAVTLVNWPSDENETFDVTVNYSETGGDRLEVTASEIRGNSSGMTQIVFSGVFNAANLGDLQISSVENSSTNTMLSISSNAVSYATADELTISAPEDTVTSSCILGDTSVEDFFDSWLMDVSASGSCGNIEIFNDWDGVYPTCEETVSVTFTALASSCGDTVVSISHFSVEDCENPVPIPINGFFSAQVSSNQCVDVNINQFDAGSFDDCGEVTLSYSSDQSDTVRTFCCDVMQEIREIEFWVMDDAGNQDFVVTYIRIEGCPSPRYEVRGQVRTPEGDGVQGVEVFLEEPSAAPISRVTNGGFYAFFDVDQGAPYTVRAYKNDDVLNGVNTLDILYVQQHILGLNTLEDPFRLIAANVNDDNRISGADLIEMRRTILGLDNQFTNNISWRFIDAREVLPDGTLPQDYAEEFRVYGQDDQNFTAVKIGDVNATATTNFADSAEAEGNHSALQFSVFEATPESGERIEVDVTSDNFSDVLGLQFTLEYDQGVFEFLELKEGVLDIVEGNYGHFSEAGMLTVSWNGLKPNSYKKHEVLFTLVFRAKDQGSLSETLQFSDVITKSEAYVGGEIRKLSLRFLEDSRAFALYQNAPNPFDSETIIKFDLPESGPADLAFYDATGQVVFMIRGDYAAGQNQVRLERSDLPVQGLYYYELSIDGQRATKKMVVAGK